MALPDVPTLHGRLYLGAWEQGLSSVADDSALLLSNAVEVMETCGFKDFTIISALGKFVASILI